MNVENSTDWTMKTGDAPKALILIQSKQLYSPPLSFFPEKKDISFCQLIRL